MYFTSYIVYEKFEMPIKIFLLKKYDVIITKIGKKIKENKKNKIKISNEET